MTGINRSVSKVKYFSKIRSHNSQVIGHTVLPQILKDCGVVIFKYQSRQKMPKETSERTVRPKTWKWAIPTYYLRRQIYLLFI